MGDYEAFIMPTAEELREEIRYSDMSETEKQLAAIRLDLLNGKVKRFDDPDYDNKYTCYEDAINCVLFWDEQRGKITVEERERLYKRYI